jgi:hypothetical protein
MKLLGLKYVVLSMGTTVVYNCDLMATFLKTALFECKFIPEFST